MLKNYTYLVLLTRLLLGALIAWSYPVSAADSQQPKQPLIIFAASSLTDVLPQITAAWAYQNEVEQPVLSHAPSATLARQILNGAPADILISANKHWIMEVARKELFSHSPTAVAHNQLVFAVNKNAGTSLKNYSVLKADKLILADPKLSPSGAYAMRFLRSLYEIGALEGKFLYTNNVRASMRMIELTHYPGFIYRTDAMANQRLKIIMSIDPVVTGDIVYMAGALSNRKQSQKILAEDFVKFLRSPSISNIWRHHAFDPIKPVASQ